MAKEKELGIDEKLNRLLKNVANDYIGEDEVDKDYISEDEVAKSEDDDEKIVYDFSEGEDEEEASDEEIADEETDNEEIENDEELEKTEDDQIAENDEESEEENETEKQVEEDEDTEEVDYDDLLDRIKDDLGLDEINGRLDDLTENLKKVVDLLEINTDNANEVVEKNKELEKSINLLSKKLSRANNIRKSVKNAQVFNKYEEEKKTYKDLSKSQRAEILSNEFLAGNRNVSALDVSKAEQGAPLSEALVSIIEKHLI